MSIKESRDTMASQENSRTTKYVTMELTVVFYGDYYDADEVTGRVQDYVSGALHDRDDLRSWQFGTAQVREVAGDAEGYDG